MDRKISLNSLVNNNKDTEKLKKTLIKPKEPDNTNIVPDVDIEVKSDLEHVRKRLGMYLPNINYCVYEILDNSVDEFMAGACTELDIHISNSNVKDMPLCVIKDNGRGLPIKPSTTDPNKTMAEIALSTLKSGGKFDQSNKVKTGGLNGVGASSVNFTSSMFKADIYKNNIHYSIGWEKGELVSPFKEEGPSDISHGTTITLIPDKEIWEDYTFSPKDIEKRVEQVSFLNAGLICRLDMDFNNYKVNKVYQSKGLVDYIDKLMEGKTPIIDNISASASINDAKLGNITVDIAIGYNDGYNEEIYVFTNNIPNALGGSHLTGFKKGLFDSINNYYIDSTKKPVTLEASDTREGIIAVVSVKLSDPVFEGQGKAKLNMPSIIGKVSSTVKEAMEEYLDKNPNQAKAIIAKALQAQLTRESIRRARETTRASKTGFPKPVKLASCTANNPEECEIWIVEGDSAAGTAKKARDRKTQAVLPIFGKINNPYNINLADIFKSTKLKDALGAFGTDIGENFNIEKLNYHKIIIMSDADVDGLHIQTLWIAFFYRFLRPIIENGHLYLSCPPLFKVTKNKKEYKYCYSIEEKDQALLELGSKSDVQRYKGLGEMKQQDLGDSTMNKENRILIQVTCEDAEKAENMLNICMGDDASLRKSLLLNDEINCDLV